MNSRWRQALAFAALLGLVGRCAAADGAGPAAPGPLPPAAAAHGAAGRTLAQAYERAALARLSLRIAGTEIDAARARLAQARAMFYPSVEWVASLDVINNFDSFSGITAAVTIPELNVQSSATVTQTVPRYQAATALQLKYDAYTGGRHQAQASRQALALQGAELAQRQALQDLAQEVASSWFKLMQACVEQAGAARRVQRVQALAELAQQRLQEGRIAAIEQRTQALALQEARSAQRSRDEALDIAQAELAATLQDAPAADEPAAQGCGFAGSVEGDLAYLAPLSDHRLGAEQHRLRVQAAQAAAEVERAALKPQVSLYARYAGIGRSDSSMHDGLSNLSRRQASVGVQMSFNLFDADLTHQRVAESQAEARRRSLLAEQAAAELAQARRRGDIRLRMADTRLALAQDRLALAQAQATLARERLQAGSGTAAAADEQADKAQDAADELRLAELEGALARLATLFPIRSAAAAAPAPTPP